MAVTETGQAASRELDELYRRHGSDVYRYAFAVLGNHADAEDVTQTTFLNAYRALEQGVRPRKPSNWLLAIASNAIKQRFRTEQARPRQVELDESTAGSELVDVEGPTVGELLAALSKIPPQQRQAIVLREFEGRSYAEIAEILGVTTSALETLLFRARRSLAEELEHQLTCTEAQLAVSRATDGRLGRKERRRLRDHLGECPDCARFARAQQRHRKALKGLMLLPVPLSLHFVKGIEGTASAALLPGASLSAAALPAGTGAIAAGAGTGAAATGGVFAGGAVLKAAAVVAAATMASGVAMSAASEDGARQERGGAVATTPGERVGQVAPRGVLVPGNGVAKGKADAPGQSTRGTVAALHSNNGKQKATSKAAKATKKAKTAAKAKARGHAIGRAGTRARPAPSKSVDRSSPSTRAGSTSKATKSTTTATTPTASSSKPAPGRVKTSQSSTTTAPASGGAASGSSGGSGKSKKP